ncbi:MAG: response regulator [Pseudomonadota bacterium]
MADNSNLSVLIVDPSPGMRGSLQNMLNQAGITKTEYAVSSGTAIKQLAKSSYDIILCEYDLGGGQDNGQDGQQLLEDLRHHKLIGLWTIFIMITSEGVYSKVVSAAELTPTDYILKPFTVDMLSGRIARAIERRTAFLPTYQLISQGNLREAIKSSAKGEANFARYALDFVRLRAELHVSLGELGEAETLYQAVITAKPVGWAQLGLARTLFAQERYADAEAMLEQVIVGNARLMAAYDLLARCYEAGDEPAKAQKALEDAVAISPHMIRRLRRLGEVALETGDVAAAERSFKQVVSKAKYSEFRDPEDHVNLIKALVKKGDTTQAAGVMRDLEKSLRGNPNLDVCSAVSNALLLKAAGDADGAVKQLGNAVAGVRSAHGLSSHLKIDLARDCLDSKLDKEASEVMIAVLNDANAGVSTAQAMSIFVKAGRADLAEGMGNQLKLQVQQMMQVAVERTGMGDYKGAAQSMLEALHLAPNEVPVLCACARSIIRQVEEMGWDHALAEQCHAQIELIRKREPAQPQLQALEEDYSAAKRKYGISG